MRWRKKQVVEIVSQIRLDLAEIGAKVTQINIYHMTIEQTDQIASPRIILNLHLSYGRYCAGRLIAIAILAFQTQPLLVASINRIPMPESMVFLSEYQ